MFSICIIFRRWRTLCFCNVLNTDIVAISAVLDLLIKRQVENKWDKKS